MKPKEVLGLEEIDLSDLQFWARPWDEREAAFATLRRDRPLAHFREPDIGTGPVAMPAGPGFTAVTRYADITHVSRHPEIFVSGPGAVSILDLPPEMVDYFGGMISTDNPRHARLRRTVSAAFSPRVVRSIEEGIQRRADRIIDRIAGLGECDFVAEVAAPLPLEVICDMMGIAAKDHSRVFHCSNVILSMGDPEYVPPGQHPIEAVLNAGAELNALMNDLGAHRLRHPTDDLTSALVNTNIDGEALTGSELSSFFILLVVAGNETTRNAISHGLLALTEHPDQRRLWQGDFEGLANTAVDEILRWASPVIWMRRTAAQSTEVAGQAIEAGEKLLLFYNSANRDDTVFEHPYRFDVRRSPNPHLGFGAPGPHFCLGANLAREEITVMFRELLRRLPDIEATGQPERLRSNFINGIKHLGCRFTPAAAGST